jgi:hypothetical protein
MTLFHFGTVPSAVVNNEVPPQASSAPAQTNLLQTSRSSGILPAGQNQDSDLTGQLADAMVDVLGTLTGHR